ncbi:hypothetical protein NCCP2716_27690 [Sporosarcina sp. NCCP-2716]|nr:hypothetical protein NCCP2716_27690 [Sporosarcina sp. NCCP-2716]
MAKFVPPTRFPDAATVQYSRDMKKMVRELRKTVLRVFDDDIGPAVLQYQRGLKQDALRNDGPLDVISRALQLIRGLSLGIFSNAAVEQAASRFLYTVNEFSATQAREQGAIKSIDPTVNEPWLDEFIRSAIRENVGYIQKLPADHLSAIESIVYQGTKNGTSTKEIRQQIVAQAGVTENRAEFIAVDQAGSVFGQMTARRHIEMGAPKFRWKSSKDERVRERHRELDGQVFSYEDPPAEGLPGTPFRCRCVAQAVFDDEEDA